jgi:hypothetical protein
MGIVKKEDLDDAFIDSIVGNGGGLGRNKLVHRQLLNEV